MEKKSLDMDKVSTSLSKFGYTLLEAIGKGGFASVFKAKSVKYNEDFVVKRVELTEKVKLYSDETDGEIRTLLELANPHIIKMYEHFIDDGALYIVLEYCENGSLQDMVKNGPIQIDTFWTIAEQILLALQACHSRNIAHRDIKPANILLDKYNRVRLADFGISSHIGDRSEMSDDFQGSMPYMAPEVLTLQTHDPFKADIYSLGITFFYMMTGELPYPSGTKEELYKAIMIGHVHFPMKFDPQVRMLISKMTDNVPANRPSAESVLAQVRKIIEARNNDPGLKKSFPMPLALTKITMNQTTKRLRSSFFHIQNAIVPTNQGTQINKRNFMSEDEDAPSNEIRIKAITQSSFIANKPFGKSRPYKLPMKNKSFMDPL